MREQEMIGHGQSELMTQHPEQRRLRGIEFQTAPPCFDENTPIESRVLGVENLATVQRPSNLVAFVDGSIHQRPDGQAATLRFEHPDQNRECGRQMSQGAALDMTETLEYRL